MRAAVLAVALVLVGTAQAAAPRGTSGPDRFDTVNGNRDVIQCGAGHDLVVADLKDVVGTDCEVLSRRIGLDTTPSSAAQHRTIVEPSAAGDGSTVVAVFQSGRIVDGGAAAIGWTTSADGGLTWQRGLLPDSGAARVSDPVVARDRTHGLWIATVLALFPSETRLLTYSSPDGVTWSSPVVAAAGTPLPGEIIAFDKEWITCDNGPASPHLGACYLAYTDIRAPTLSLQTSHDGGATWDAAVQLGSQGTAGPTGAIPVVTAGGVVVVVDLVGDADVDNGSIGMVIESATSLDAGTTFAAPVRIATIALHPTPLRVPPLPSVAVTLQGIDVVWPDCSAHPGCTSNDIVLSTSPDGAAWSAPRAIASGGDYLTPTVGASDDGSSAAVLAYVRLPGAGCCKLGVRLFRSSDGGATWGTPTRLDAQPMDSAWVARSLSGLSTAGFLGDYMAVAFTGARPVPVFVVAHAPVSGSLRQDLYATTRLP